MDDFLIILVEMTFLADFERSSPMNLVIETVPCIVREVVAISSSESERTITARALPFVAAESVC